MTLEQIEQLDEEDQKFWRNMNEMKERSCDRKRAGGMPCSMVCDKYNTTKCIHPEKAGFPAKRY